MAAESALFLTHGRKGILCIGDAYGGTLELLAERGRSLDDLEISISPYLKPLEPDALPRYRDAGVDQLIVLCFAPERDALLKALDTLAESLVEPAQRL